MRTTMNSQRGLGLMTLIMGLVVVVVLALFAMKIVPSFLEYRTMRAAVGILAKTAQSPADVRRGWDSRSAIDDYSTVKASDLEITREGNQLVVAFAYRKEVPLFGNVGIYIDYAASSRDIQ